MKIIEKLLVYISLSMVASYFFVDFPYEIYLILVFGLIIYFLRFRNYRIIKRINDKDNAYKIPQIKNTLYNLAISGIFVLFLVFIIVLSFTDLIKLREFTGIDKLVFLFIFPILGLVSSIYFSDLRDCYFITDSALIISLRYNDRILWSRVSDFEVDNNKSIVRLKRGDKTIFEMKVDKVFFKENINEIKIELTNRLNVA
jgi:hypothetical protein